MALEVAGGAGREFWKHLRPGELYLAWYADDTVWHERMSLWPTAQAGIWMVLTPDGHVHAESVRGCAAGPARGLSPGGPQRMQSIASVEAPPGAC